MDNIIHIDCDNYSNVDTNSDKIYKCNDNDIQDGIACKYVSGVKFDCRDKNNTPATKQYEVSTRESKYISEDLITIKTNYNYIDDTEDSRCDHYANSIEIHQKTSNEGMLSSDSNRANTNISKYHTEKYLKWQEIEPDSDEDLVLVPPIPVIDSVSDENQPIEIFEEETTNTSDAVPGRDFTVRKGSNNFIEVNETMQISVKDSETPVVSEGDLSTESIDPNSLKKSKCNPLQKDYDDVIISNDVSRPDTFSDSTPIAATSLPEKLQRITTTVIFSNASTQLLIEENPIEKEDTDGRKDDKGESEVVDNKNYENKDGNTDSDDDDGDDDEEEKVMCKEDKIKEIKKKVAIKKLTYLIEKLNRRIQKLEEQELSLDDMNSESVYTQLELYKKKLIKVWKQLCTLTNQTPEMERENEKPFVFKGTNHPQINKAISRFINKYQSFPDYQDVHELISTCNKFCKMKLSNQMLSSISLSAFTGVGKALKQRRIRDYKQTFGCHLTDQSEALDDPAVDDPDLRKKLEDNKRRADTNLEKTFHHFESIPAKESDQSDDDDEDDKSEDDDDDDDDGKAEKKKILKNSEDKKRKKDHKNESDSSGEETPPPDKIMAIEIDSSSFESSSDDEVIEKKSLSTLYDVKPIKSLEVKGQKSKECLVNNNDLNDSQTYPCKNEPQSFGLRNSSRTLRNNNCGSGVKENERFKSSKIRNNRFDPSDLKRPKMSDHIKSEEPRPTFVRLVDEIVSFNMNGSKANNSLFDDICKALTPSKVVVKNCMSCQVLCSRSDCDNSSKDGNLKKTSKRKRSDSDSNMPIKKNTQAIDESKENEEEKDKVAATKTDDDTINKSSSTSRGKQSDNPEHCVTLFDSDVEDGKKNEKSLARSIYGKVVGEVLTFQDYYESDMNKDEEDLVMAVSSLRKKDVTSHVEGEKIVTNNADHKKSSINNPTHSPCPPSDIVIVDDSNLKNEDSGIIFLAAYSPSGALKTNKIPQSLEIDHPSTHSFDSVDSLNGTNYNSVMESPTRRPSLFRKIMLGQRKAIKRATQNFSSNMNVVNPRMLSPCVSTNLSVVRNSSVLAGMDRHLLAQLFDPTVPTTGLPKLPTRVMKKINNITKKITSNRGRGRTMASPRLRPFAGFVTKHRPYFAAGQTFAMANANLMSEACRAARRNLQFPGGTQKASAKTALYPPHVLSPTNKRIARPSVQKNKYQIGSRPKSDISFNQNAMPETVIIDDDDSNLPASNQSQADLVAQPTQKGAVQNDFHKINNNRRPIKSNTENLNSASHPKVKKKIHSDGSDVIVCGSTEFYLKKFAESNSSTRNNNAKVFHSLSHFASESVDAAKNVDSSIRLDEVLASTMSSMPWENSITKSTSSQQFPISSSRTLKTKTTSSDSDVIFCGRSFDEKIEDEIPHLDDTTHDRPSNLHVKSSVKVVSNPHSSIVTPPSDDDKVDDAIILLD